MSFGFKSDDILSENVLSYLYLNSVLFWIGTITINVFKIQEWEKILIILTILYCL